MGDVIALRKPEEAKWLSGQARCSACKHTWEAASPVGTDRLECPSCATFMGQYVHECVPDEEVWECACGCDTFRVTHTAAFCIKCGTRQKF